MVSLLRFIISSTNIHSSLSLSLVSQYVSCYGVQYLYDDIQGWIIAIPVITGGCSCLLGYLTWLIYKEFGSVFLFLFSSSTFFFDFSSQPNSSSSSSIDFMNLGWDIFKQIGADLRLKRIVQQKYILSMLQKFNLFFFIGFSIQFLMLSSAMTSVERALTIMSVYPSLTPPSLDDFTKRRTSH